MHLHRPGIYPFMYYQILFPFNASLPCILTSPQNYTPLQHAYSEIRGEPLGVKLDLLPIIAEMITYNGGQPLRCLA